MINIIIHQHFYSKNGIQNKADSKIYIITYTMITEL